MKIQQVKIFSFTLPLARPLKIHSVESKERQGLIVKFVSDAGSAGFGEISPLPGLSRESLSQAITQITQLVPKLVNLNLPKNFEHLNGTFEKWFSTHQLFPPVRFGIEMGILNLLANSKGISFGRLIHSPNHGPVPVCGLLEGDKNQILQDARQLIAQGFKAVKLKVGRTSLTEDIATVRVLSEILDGKALLRLDANQLWTINQAVEFGHEVGCTTLEYLEDPFADLTNLEEFLMKTTIPVALDESLLKLKMNEIKSLPGVDVLVLKPTLLGGIEKTWQWIQEAHRFGIKSILSSCFETGLGIMTLAELAGCLPILYPHGFDTLKWFSDDIAKERVSLTNGSITLRPAIQSEDELNLNCLKEISPQL